MTARPKSLVLDVFGAYVLPMGNWVAVADLIRLMGVLGVDQQAVRAAVSRMTREGVLTNERRGPVRGYAVSAATLPMMERGDRRIFFAREPADLHDGWVLVTSSVPEVERRQRYQLRKRLTWLGFGFLPNGVGIAPRRTLPDLMIILEQFDLTSYVQIFEATYRGFDDVRDLVAAAWDLDGLRALYKGFLAECKPLRGRRARSDAKAYVDYTLMLHNWRKLPYLDPGLPPEVLPPKWEGRTAAETFFELRTRLEGPATRFVRGVFNGRSQVRWS